MKLQVVLLGPQKTPSYARVCEWFDCDVSATEKPKWYRICYNSSYRVGDGLRSLFEWQCAYMCPPNMEVYGVHCFEEIDGEILDNNLMSMDEWIDEHCCQLMEICDDDFDEDKTEEEK